MRDLILILFFITSANLFAQEDTVNVKRAPLQGFNISGAYRFYGQHRMMREDYLLDASEEIPSYFKGRSILIGDATQLPELTLNINGNPTPSTTFGTDIVVWNQNTGDFDYYRGLQLGINLYGGFNTDYGNVSIKAGGIHWHSMTAFTMNAFAGYNRYSLFQRNPWDPQFKNIDQRYSEYYESGAITQDGRWANQAFQGFIMDVGEMPFGLSANIIYGNTQTAGASINAIEIDSNNTTNNSFIKFYNTTTPNYVYGGRLIKSFKKHSISLNTFNEKSYQDELATIPIDNNILTTEFNLNFKKVKISGEVGMGKYMDLDAGEMVSLKAKFDKKLTKIPIEMHVFRISPNVVNRNGEFVNSSVNTVDNNNGISNESGLVANTILQPTGSSMLGIGQMANNRQGFNLNADIPIKDLVFTIGNGISKEIENINNNITFGHAINSVSFSELWRWQNWPSGVGPYGRKSNLFRGMYETVTLTDLADNGEVINDKYFNTIETQLKYKFNFLGREWYSYYLGSYASVQTKFSPITVFNEDAYIRVYSHQLENYYTIHPKLVLAQYIGVQRNIANYSTQTDVDSKRPLNQTNLGLGLGFDYMMAKNTGLYFRHRWFSFEDSSFEYDTFKATESTVEVKIYF